MMVSNSHIAKSIPKVAVNEQVAARVANRTCETVRAMEPGVEFWQKLSFRVAWSAAAGLADQLGVAMQPTDEVAARWASGVDADSVAKEDDDLACDALELLQKCVGLRWQMAQEGAAGAGPHGDFMHKNDEFCIQMMDFMLKMMNF